MHDSVRQWVQQQVSQHDLADRDTLDVGSYNVNGTVRDLFTGRYVGLDMRDGPGVDVVGEADALPFGDGEFDTLVCCEMLEHDPTFWLSFPEFNRVLKPGGWLLVTTRGIGFPYHEHPEDFWRFTLDALEHLCGLFGFNAWETVEDPEAPGVFCLAKKL